MPAQSARVIAFPNAVSKPVQQVPRRGRYPKFVTNIRDARILSERRQAALYQKEIDSLEGFSSILIEETVRVMRKAADLRKKVECLAECAS